MKQLMLCATLIGLFAIVWPARASQSDTVALHIQTLHYETGIRYNGLESTLPDRQVSYASDGIIVSYQFDKAVVCQDDLYDDCETWRIGGFGINDTPTEAATLQRIDNFVIPKGYEAVAMLQESSFVDFNFKLSPSRPALIESGDIIYTTDNVPNVTAFEGLFPTCIIENVGIAEYRGNRLLRVGVSPIQYDYANSKVRAYTRLTYKVLFTREANRTQTAPADTFLCANDAFLYNNTVNGPMLIEGTVPLSYDQTSGYVIISTPKFSPAVEKFAEWKRTLGFPVKTLLKADWTPSTIKTEIQTAKTDNSNLRCLLIVGDYEDVPAEMGSFNGISYVSDFHYGCLSSNDDLPDLLRGRLPVSTLLEANVVIDKIIQYEKNPPTSPDFYMKGINCAYFQDWNRDSIADARFAETSENVRNHLLSQGKEVKRIYKAKSNVFPMRWNNIRYSYGEYIPDELHKPEFAWNGNASDIISAIDSGAFYVLHRDHGSSNGWGDPFFNKQHVRGLRNGDKLPVVFSINCQTGQYDGGTCFAEEFLKNSQGGCVAIFAATQVTYSGYNDALTIGMFGSIWPQPLFSISMPIASGTWGEPCEPVYELGQILDQGWFRMSNIMPNTSTKTYEGKVFHCFGDPGMMIYTDCPTAFEHISLRRDSNCVQVAAGENAFINFRDMITGRVVRYHGISASYATEHPECISVSVTAHNKIPSLFPAPTTYLQNETIVGARTINASKIMIGSSVTNQKEQGPVVFDGGNIMLEADSVNIINNTSVRLGTDLWIKQTR